MAEWSGEGFLGSEIVRLEGEILVQAGRGQEARKCFEAALEEARQAQLHALELRAAASLARLWASRSEPGTARDVLLPVLSRFTEGDNTADIRGARAQLASIA